MSSIVINPYQFAVAGGGAKSLTFTDAADLFIAAGPGEFVTTHTFTAVAIGTADATRRVFACINWFGPPSTLSSATIGGVAATIHVQAKDDEDDTGAAICSALLASGTTANIVVNFSDDTGIIGCHAYRMVNQTQTTPHDTMTDGTPTGTTLTGTIDIPSDGFLLATSSFDADLVTGAAWTGATEDVEEIPAEVGSFIGLSSASEDLLSSQTGRTVTVVWSATDPFEGPLVALSWQ